MKQTFDTPLEEVDRQDRFSRREPGLTHPDIESLFVRLRDNGDLEIVAGEGLAIIMRPSNRSITFIADHVNIMTQAEEGLRWNHVSFNSKAVSFHEPTFITKNDEQLDAYHTYEGLDPFTDNAPPSTRSSHELLAEYAQDKKEVGEEPAQEEINLPEDYFPC